MTAIIGNDRSASKDLWSVCQGHPVSFCMSYCFHRKEGNGTPLQYSCLENPMDGGAW